MNRRHFLGSLAVGPFVAPATIRGANDRIQLGFIGVGRRASALLTQEEFPRADIVATADCNLERCREFSKLKPSGDKWGKYQDYHRMFEKEKLDAVFIETTTHARALIAIHAMQA